MDIYIVFVCEKLEEHPITGFPVYGDSRAPGFYTSVDEARETIKNNRGDLWETIYDYATIEKASEGLYGGHNLHEWYKYNRETDRYERIETPKFERHICGIVIG